SNYPTVPFPIDHIIARQHGGSTTLDNLALSCLHDNTHKGPNVAGIDPISKRISRQFNPRRDNSRLSLPLSPSESWQDEQGANHSCYGIRPSPHLSPVWYGCPSSGQH